MAVRPQELDENLKKEAAFYDAEIDKLIRKKQGIHKGTTGISCTITVDGILSGMQSSHFQFIRDNYIAAGWTDVKMKDDQREGTWLEFTYEESFAKTMMR
jgi:hypothetical protein